MINYKLLGGVVLAASFAMSAVTPSIAKVTVKEKTRYYTVSGKTGAQVYKSILKRGPKQTKLKHAMASTEYRVKFSNFQGGVVGRHCRLTNMDSHVTLTYVLPKWNGYKSASKTDQQRWDRFLLQIIRHEKKHGQIFIKGTKDMERRMKAVKSRVSKGCSDYQERPRKAAIKSRVRMDREHQRFERRDGFRFSRVRIAERKLFRSK